MFDFFKNKKGKEINDGRRSGESDNPFLNARRTWNHHLDSVVSSRRNWQILGFGCLCIALASIQGIVSIGSQSKFVPYVVQVDKLGKAVMSSTVDRAPKIDRRIIESTLAEFITNWRLVTADQELQKRMVYRFFGFLRERDPAALKISNEMAIKEKNPFQRSQSELVNIEISTVLQQSSDTWQVEWIETTFERSGQKKIEQRMRALLTIETMAPTETTTDEQIRTNPLGIYIKDITYSKQI